MTVAGEVIVKQISYRNADLSIPEETEVKRWNAETDTQGRLSFRYPIPSEGQYRVEFVTRDSANEEVQGNAVFWVNGPKFDGRVYRFNELEIIADKRTYKLGETAHLLLNVAESNSRVLFADDVSQGVLLHWRFIDVPARTTVIDLPIEAKHVPNFFVEASLVRNGRFHTELRELCVPPVQGLLNMTLRTDKAVYQPGETGKVSIAVSDMNGEPIQGQVTLSIYDKAVTYIQEEFGPSPKVFFHGQKRYHSPYASFSGAQTFSVWGNFEQPEWYSGQGEEPEGWSGSWQLEQSGLTLDSLRQFRSGFIGGGGGGGGGAGGDVRREINAVGVAAAKREPVFNSRASGEKRKDIKQGIPTMVDPEVRVNFADTALWLPALTLDASGKAEEEIRFPQSLTTWRVHGYALTKATQVGDSTNEVITTKSLLVRLEAPRFFIERDEVVLSANVHNYLSANKSVRAELVLPSEIFEPLSSSASIERNEGEIHLVANASIKPNGEKRFDWAVRVKKSGLAHITVKAFTDEESDGMRLAFPVLVHGISKTLVQSGSYRVTQEGERGLTLDLPREIDPGQTRLEVTLSPSLAGVLLDALPYLAGYPYGCVEQTMSRFYPTILVKDALNKMRINLETLGRQRRQMNSGDLTNRFGHWLSPVFDSAELERMVRAGLDRIYYLQRNDGGWGWWREDDSSPYQTAYVVLGLRAARQAGVNVDDGVFERALNYLENSTEKEIAKPKDQQQIGSLQTQVYLAYVLSNEQRLQSEEAQKWFDKLYQQRGELNNYGRALLALTLHNEKREEKARIVLRNLLQFVERDDSNETAWVRTPNMSSGGSGGITILK